MCRNPSKIDSSAKPRMLLVSLKSFSESRAGGSLPDTKVMGFTVVFFICFLFLCEAMLNHFFLSIQNAHPLLQDETNRNILARHIGVDAFSCFLVAYLGWNARHVAQDMIDAIFCGKNSMPRAYENRLFKYHPESCRIVLYFFGFQVKNLYDTIIWQDGPEFIAHHILTVFTALGAMFPGTAHFYVPFYLGFSEASTAILCLLANYDDDHGVKGLAEAFPQGKVILGALFALSFVVCRVFLWSSVSYYYCRDALNALRGNDPRLEGRKIFLHYTFVSLGLLSVLQVVWLGEIIRIGKHELDAMGLL